MNRIKKILIAPKAIYNSRKLIKNLSSSLYQYLILRKQNIKLKLRNRETITVSRFLYPRLIYYYYLGYIVDINKNEIKIKLDDKIYSIPINALYSNDIGGDAYNEMLENIKLNNMKDKIIPINIGINYEKDYIFINTKNFAQVASSFFNSNNKGIRVSAGKLSDIIEKYNINAQILKMDCEGCEYDIILKDYDTIREFNEIGFEYHAYNTKIPVSKLLEKLNKDFECKFIKGGINEKIGIIHCIRKK